MYTEGEVFIPCLLSRMHDEKLILITSIRMLKLPSFTKLDANIQLGI